jgi:steroid 5-alpha reductase family enzyme
VSARVSAQAFNLVFVCLFQQLEILAFSVPAVAALQSNAPLGNLDCAAAGLFLLLVAGEAVADYQMFAFQTAKCVQ